MSFDPQNPIASAFAEIIGKPAWQVQKGYGSFLTLEFGEPHLDITMIERRNRRLASIRGDWHLWIYCCDWSISRDGDRIAKSGSKADKIARAADELNGQILTGVEIDAASAATRFSFDLGGVLETRRWKNEDESFDQWLLYAPDGNVLTVRDDAHFAWHPASGPNTETWLPLPA